MTGQGTAILAMDAFFTDHFVLPLPSGHRFPMEKYRMLREQVSQLPGLVLREAPAADDQTLLLAHSPEYVGKVIDGSLSPAEIREIGFPWSPQMVERSRRSVGATLAACASALRDGVGVNLAGGTHHAYRDKGSGYCVFNDAAIAARWLQQEQGTSFRVAIIDLDVHQGNGTAAIIGQDPTVMTLSMHGEKNFPFRKEASQIDIGLPDGCQDDTYLNALHRALRQVHQSFAPDFILYLAGADAHEGDRLGRLKLTRPGMLARDEAVFDFARALGVPVAVAMAGGYGHVVQTTVDVHAQTVRAALSSRMASLKAGSPRHAPPRQT